MAKSLSTIAALLLAAFALCNCAGHGSLEDGSTGANLGIQHAVEQQFPDAPIMLQVANCESRLRQFNSDGSVVHGTVHYADSGVFQINKSVHGPTAKKLGINLDTMEGNVQFARHLYEQEGTQPWASSRGCWGKYHTASK